MKHDHEGELARVLGVAPPQAYERGTDGKRPWWRRALELFSTFKGKHGDALTREDVAEYRKQKAREELPVTDPERHLGLRVSRLEDLAKGLVVDGDIDVNDLGRQLRDQGRRFQYRAQHRLLDPQSERCAQPRAPQPLTPVPGGVGAALVPRPARGRRPHCARAGDGAAQQAGNARVPSSNPG